MRVLEPGRPQKGWSIEKRCTGEGNGKGGCGALLLVEFADLHKTMRHARDETDYFATFKCSECGVLTDLFDEDLRGAPFQASALPSFPKPNRGDPF